jgi:hypothetical protein
VVNASLNWASIVGIVLAVGGAFLYFMRSFKPALARDYDVFFAAIGLLCGGILFFQGWRLDPILQFGQFLLAGTTVFFAYESVRLRGVTTEQARRSSYFDDEEPAPFRPRGGLGGGRPWDEDVERLDEPEPVRRRIRSRDEGPDEDFYRPRRASRAAIPERAASRREPPSDEWDRPRADYRGGDRPDRSAPSPAARDRDPAPDPGPGTGRYSAGGPRGREAPEFGARRRDGGAEPRRGSRPVPSVDSIPRSSRRSPAPGDRPAAGPPAGATPGVPQGFPIRDAGGGSEADLSDADFSPLDSRRPRTGSPTGGAAGPERPPGTGGSNPGRDNSSRFDD